MTELYDVIAGSETGAIIAGALVIPSDPAGNSKHQNKQWAADAMAYYKEFTEELYSSQSLAWYESLWIMIVCMVLCGLLVSWCAGKKLNPKRQTELITHELLMLIEMQREDLKNSLQKSK